MASSPWPRTTGDAPTPPIEAADTAATTPTSEQHMVKGGGNVAAAAAVPQDEEEAKPHFPQDDDSEAVIQEHEQKIKRYQAILAACLKAKFFSKKAFDGGNIYEAETIVEGGTIQSSRWPCTRSFANPEFFSRDKNSSEKGNSPSSTTDSSIQNSSPPLAGDVPGKRQQSKKT